MKRILSFVIAALFQVCLFTVDVNASEAPSVSASAYILYCPDNKAVIMSKNLHTPMGMASTTKIMTALLAYEQADLSDVSVKFTEEMTAEGSSMYLKAGDTLRLSDLAAGMMAASGNDGANAIAVALGGSAENFAKLMNERAEKIGMKNTNFVTPSGLSDENHYSTVYDMALLMSCAMEREDFSAMTKKSSVTVDFIRPEGYSVTYNNHNRLLSMYEYATGGKTGYTIRDGRCLVTSARKNGLRLVAVTFNDRDDWQDHIALYEYGFGMYTAVSSENFSKSYCVGVSGSDKSTVSVSCKEDFTAVVSREDIENIRSTVVLPCSVVAPVRKGDVLGRISVSVGDEIICEADLCADEDAAENSKLNIITFLINIYHRIF